MKNKIIRSLLNWLLIERNNEGEEINHHSSSHNYHQENNNSSHLPSPSSSPFQVSFRTMNGIRISNLGFKERENRR